MLRSLRERHRPTCLRRGRAVAAVAILGVLASACVSPGSPGVKVNSLDADLVFGVAPEEESAPTPVEAALPPSLTPDFPSTPPLRPFTGNDFDMPLFIEDPPPDPNACSPVVLKPTPQRDAEVEITGDPLVGSLPFRGKFSRDLNTHVEETELPVQTRWTFNFEKASDGTYTFDQVQPVEGVSGQFLVSSFFVNPASDSPSVRPPTEAVIEGTPRARSDPEAGLVLKRTALVDAEGKPVPGTRPFEPTTGILLLPLPIQPEDYVSSAVDPDTGKSLVLNASVKARDRVNVCGEPVDAFVVESFVSISDDETLQQGGGRVNDAYRWVYLVAPQYGGIIIHETIGRTFDDGRPPEAVERTLNSIEPGPLPESLP